MPGRKFSQANSGYRYGFNGKENDNDVKGEGNQQDYGMRIYDPRLGRFLSVDPLLKDFPWNSCYSYAESDPINYIDLDGMEKPDQKAQNTFNGARIQRRGYNNLNILEKPYRFLDNSMTSGWNGTIDILEFDYKVITGKIKYTDIGFSVIKNAWSITGWFNSTSTKEKISFLKSSGQNIENWENLAGAIIMGKALSALSRLPSPRFIEKLNAEPLPISSRTQIEIRKLDESIEKGSQKFLQLSEKLDDGHYLSKHGAQTTRGEQLRRSITGIAPDVSTGRPVNSSRFFTNNLQYDAYQKAEQIYNATGRKSFSFSMGKNVGEGFLTEGRGYVITQDVQAVFKNGKLLTLYPKLE